MARESFGCGISSLEASSQWVGLAAPGPSAPVLPPTCSQPSPRGAVPVLRGGVRAAGHSLLGRCRLWPSSQQRPSLSCRQGSESQHLLRPHCTAQVWDDRAFVKSSVSQHILPSPDSAGQDRVGFRYVRHSVSCVMRGVPKSAAMTL